MNGSIPRLNLNHFICGSPEQRNSFVSDLGRGLEQFGFVTIIDHGIERHLSKGAYDAAAQFFALPDTIKLKYEDRLSGRQRGYTPMGKEKAKDHSEADLKEFWHTGIEPANGLPENIWPAEIEAFKERTCALFNALSVISVHLASAIESYLEIPSGQLSSMMVGGNTVLRSIHYPVPEKQVSDRLWAAPHEDINLMTLLIEASGAGLEILTRDGKWLAVDCKPEEIILDTGDMMARLTNGLLPAVTHRVVAPSRVQTSRYSMPFFIHPAPDALLKPFDSPKIKKSQNAFHPTASEYLNERLRENGVLTVDFDPLDDGYDFDD